MRIVCTDDQPVTINGAGKDQVVMMPLDTFLKLHEASDGNIECSPFKCHHASVG